MLLHNIHYMYTTSAVLVLADAQFNFLFFWTGKGNEDLVSVIGTLCGFVQCHYSLRIAVGLLYEGERFDSLDLGH